MSYKYQNGSTPNHVDSSMSNTKYPHTGIPIARTDNTKVALSKVSSSSSQSGPASIELPLKTSKTPSMVEVIANQRDLDKDPIVVRPSFKKK